MISAGNKAATVDKRGMRVLMLLENCPYSEDGRVRCEANSLAAAGHKVTVICRSKRGEGWYKKFGEVETYQYPPPPSANGLFGYLIEYSYALTVTALITA